MIEPEAVPPAPRHGLRRRAVIAGVTLLAVVAGGVAVAAGGGGHEAKPLALMAGNGRSAGSAESQTMAAPAPGMAADSKFAGPYPYGWGLKFEVDGDLPDLPDHAAAWRVSGPTLDRAAMARIATALGLTGAPVQQDGAWFVDGGDWTLNAYGGGDTWSVNLFRSRYAGRPDDSGTVDDTPTGPAISRAEAEQQVRDLLDRMGAPAATWKIETTETELSMGWGCATPAPAITASPASSGSGSASSGSGHAVSVVGKATPPTPADKPLPGGVASCPPPPPPVRAFNVAFSPVLDGRRADWPVWNVTLRSDGRVENLYGSWVTFERGDNYKLRGVDAALKELQSPTPPPIAYATDTPAIAKTAPAPASDAGPGSAGPGSAGSDSAGSAPSRLPAVDPVAPAVGMPDGPVCPPVAMPMRAEDDKATSSIEASCVPPAPQVVKITGVELGLIQASVFEDGRARLHLVPAYRFTGHFDNGTPWETSVIALHPDAIAPPPNVPIADDVQSGGGATGSGKAVPPMPPAVEHG